MISLIRAPFSAADKTLLQKLFAKRYELFVKGRGWRTLERADCLDIDAYDDENTIYIVKQINENIVGGARLRPTIINHMLRDVFGDLCDGGSPAVGPTIFECSRTFVARRHPQRREIFADILLAAAQFCLDNEIDTLTGILETWWLNSYLALGLSASPLGMPHDVDGSSLLAVSFMIDSHVRDNLANRLAIFRTSSAIRTERESGLRAA